MGLSPIICVFKMFFLSKNVLLTDLESQPNYFNLKTKASHSSFLHMIAFAS